MIISIQDTNFFYKTRVVKILIYFIPFCLTCILNALHPDYQNSKVSHALSRILHTQKYYFFEKCYFHVSLTYKYFEIDAKGCFNYQKIKLVIFFWNQHFLQTTFKNPNFHKNSLCLVHKSLV